MALPMEAPSSQIKRILLSRRGRSIAVRLELAPRIQGDLRLNRHNTRPYFATCLARSCFTSWLPEGSASASGYNGERPSRQSPESAPEVGRVRGHVVRRRHQAAPGGHRPLLRRLPPDALPLRSGALVLVKITERGIVSRVGLHTEIKSLNPPYSQ